MQTPERHSWPSVLCVLASEYYDPNEYIRDYNEFISYKKEYEV